MKYITMEPKVDFQRLGIKASEITPTLRIYIPDSTPELYSGKPRPMIVICPGGGYAFVSEREAEPIAFRFLSAGFAAAVLDYTVGYDIFPAPQLELAQSVAWIRSHAAEWNVDPDKIVVAGFSAGGHLAGSYGTLWNHSLITDYFGFHNNEHRPNGMILSYPVLTSACHAHTGSVYNLLGDRRDDPTLLELICVEKQVGPDTPPAFIWHTYDDPVVPVENSLYMAIEMRKAGIPIDLHIYSHGSHGLSLASAVTTSAQNPDSTIQPECQNWIEMACNWIENL